MLLLYILVKLFLKEYFEIFTRLMSTWNALWCSYYAISNLNYNYLDLNYIGTSGLIDGLKNFYKYLFIDGVFHLSTTIQEPTRGNILGLVHHWVGGYGIYLIATERRGLGLGIYFLMTEISTPLLNLSWYLYINKIEGKNVFWLFWAVFGLVRVVTIPVLMYYLIHNRGLISGLGWVHLIMTVGGSLVLTKLNLTWFTMITRKVY